MAESLVTQALSAWDDARRSDDRESDQVRSAVRREAVILASDLLGLTTVQTDWNVRGSIATLKAEGLELSVDTGGDGTFTLKGEGDPVEVTSLADIGRLLTKKEVIPADPVAKAKVTRAT